MKFNIKKFRVVADANVLKATADVTLREVQTLPDGSVGDIYEIATIHDIKLVEGRDGLFLSMPSLKRKDRYYMVATFHHEPLVAEIRAEMIRLYEEQGGLVPGAQQPEREHYDE